MTPPEFGVGLIGLGTIGTGVVKVLAGNADLIAARLGARLRLVRVADLDLERDRGVELGGIPFDADAEALIDDPAVDLVVELIGGCGAAKGFILRALSQGKSVVTANKALLAQYGTELFDAARKGNADLAFEASVGGGIPLLRALREGFCANRIESVVGIVNGTANYVLTEMEHSGASFEEALGRAQQLGYAEEDPRFDIEGIDAAHKIALLAAMAFGVEIRCEDIPTEGIGAVEPIDFEAAREFGYRIKALAIAKRHGGEEGEPRIEIRVQPTVIPATSLLAQVEGSTNAVAVCGDAVGPTLLVGAGAGEMPTASAVVADLMELARELRRGSRGRVAPLSYVPGEMQRLPLVPPGELPARCYLRLRVADRAGVLARIGAALGAEGVSIESVLQTGRGAPAGQVPVLILTHTAPEAAVRRALERIDALPELRAPTRLFRIEEEL